MKPLIKNRAFSLLFGILIFLPVLLLSVYLTLPLIAELFVKKTFNEHGLELIEFQLPRPSFDELTAKTIRLQSLVFMLEDKTEIDIRGARFSVVADAPYSVNVSSINVQPAFTEKSESAEAVDLLTLLPATLMQKLPAFRLFVQSLVLDTPAIELINLTLDVNGDGITAKSQLHTIAQADNKPLLGQFLNSELALNISAANTINLYVVDANAAPLLGVKLSLSAQEDQLYGALTITNKLKNVNWPINNSDEFVVQNSELNAKVSFSLPAKQQLTRDGLSQLLLQGQLQQNADVKLAKSLEDAQLMANATFDASLNTGQWRVNLAQGKAPFMLLKGQLARAFFPLSDEKLTQTGNVVVTIHKPLVIQGSLSADALISIDEGDVALSYLEDDKQLIDLRLSDVNLATVENGADEKINALTLYSHIAIDKVSDRFGLKGISIDAIKGMIHSRLSFQEGSILLEPLPKSHISLGNVRFDDYYAKELALDIPPQRIKVDLNTRALEKISVDLKGKGLEIQDANIKTFALHNNVSFKASHLIIDSSTEAMSADVSGASHYIPLLISKATIELDKADVKTASVKLANSCHDPLLNASWRAVNNRSELEIQWQQTFSSSKTLRQWLNTSMIPLDFTEGTFAGHLLFDINESNTKIRALDISLKDIQGVNAMGTFKGVQLQLSSPLQSSTEEEVIKFDSLLASLNASVAELNTGFKLNELEFDSVLYDRAGDWHLAIPLMTAKVFSGEMAIRDETINFNKDIQLKVLLDQIDLSALVKTQQVNGLQTSGRLSGYIPIRYANGQMQVLDGEMHSIENGNIRYSTPLSQQDNLNEQFKLTLDVLENFNYSSLNTKIVYDADTLLLKSSIVGKNPGIKHGQTVNLNLNTEVGLKGAIEVMRVQSGIDSRIEKFVSSKVTPNNKQYFCE